MDLATFERRAFALWEEIPARFREGVTVFAVEPGVWRKEEFEDGWCYGTCEPDPVMEHIPGAPVSSVIRIWYGSFVQIEASQGELDWEAELEETVRHELQHHMEWRAGVDHLGDEDDVQDDNERRLSGRSFTPWFHRHGVSMGGGAWLADDELFIEVELTEGSFDWACREGREVAWGGLRAWAPPTEGNVDVDSPRYVEADVEQLEERGEVMPWGHVSVVWVRRRKSAWRHLLAWLRILR